MYKNYIKPTIDWLIALVAILLLSPLFIIVAIVIKIDTNGPVFFVQQRLGRNGRIFKIFKFRSMIVNGKSNIEGKLYEDDPRITKTGRFIRKTSIDELPQLFNILKGEMSFIGPRPPLTYFPKTFKDYSEVEKQRFTVKPGISGLAQTRCRDIHDWEINILIDLEYVNNFSIGMDIRLFLSSLFFFFRTDNIYRERMS